MWIRVNDTVMVIRGDDRGARGKVLRLERATGKLVRVVEKGRGVNLAALRGGEGGDEAL